MEWNKIPLQKNLNTEDLRITISDLVEINL